MTSARTPDFDRMSDEYERLLRDPLRERFASEQSFFIRQKCRVLLDELARLLPSGRRLRVAVLLERGRQGIPGADEGLRRQPEEGRNLVFRLKNRPYLHVT